MFKAYDVVEDEGQTKITTRWVINEKETHDGLKTRMKARLCLRGFQETNVPRSDSPTASREMVKVALAVAANESWKAESLDVTAAFLQGSKLEREVFVEPPPEMKIEGEIWRLNKAGYGLYDSARLWYLKVVNHLEENGMDQVTGDEATYYYRVNDKLEGIIVLHVDDFLCLGSDLFFSSVVDSLKRKFKFSKIEKSKFRFCGIDINVTSEGIYVSQNEYVNAIEEIDVDKNDDIERPLNKKEFKAYRGATGKLIWLNEITRPDISFDSLSLSFHNKDAKVKHILAANKIIRKAKKSESFLKFGRIGNFDDLKILTHTDASHLTMDEKSKGVAGKIIFLSNKDETCVSPLHWKSKTIPQACTSAKAAETRAAYMSCDDTVGLARAVMELYTGKKGEKQIETTIKSDSQSLNDTLFSTKQIEEKMLRPTILAMKQMLIRKNIGRFDWVESYDCLADILSKKGAKGTERLLEILKTGVNI